MKEAHGQSDAVAIYPGHYTIPLRLPQVYLSTLPTQLESTSIQTKSRPLSPLGTRRVLLLSRLWSQLKVSSSSPTPLQHICGRDTESRGVPF